MFEFSFLSLNNILNLLSVIVVLIYWLFSFIIIYHLTRFGIGTQPKRIALVFLIGSMILFLANISAFNLLDIESFKNYLNAFGQSFLIPHV